MPKANTAYGILYSIIHSSNEYTVAGQLFTREPDMNEFLTEFSADYTLLWGLFIIATMATSSLALHVFWSIVLRTIANLFGNQIKPDKSNH